VGITGEVWGSDKVAVKIVEEALTQQKRNEMSTSGSREKNNARIMPAIYEVRL
jgi:hypothetical protein